MHAFSRGLPALILLLFLAGPAIAKDRVLVLNVSGAINPVVADYLSRGIEQANRDNEALVLLEMDTPGGLDTSMRIIIKAIQSSAVPVATFVSPGGSRAASAGAFITIASHIAAMAPGTNIGAAHPVNMLGGNGGDGKDNSANTMMEKVENDAAAYIRSLAELRGRNAYWAELAVRKSVSISASEAQKMKVIDLVAADRAALLAALEGREVSLGDSKVTLNLKGKSLHTLEMSKRDRILDTISNPNVAYILLMIGLVGLYFELSNPGLILPGIVGGISLILALYAMQTLPVNYAGLLLILLGGVLFIAELNVMSAGLLSAGATLSILLGSIMLMDSDDPAMQISKTVLYPTVLTFLGITLGVIYMATKIHRNQKGITGKEGLIGSRAVAKTDLNPEGQVMLHGEMWNAECPAAVLAGEEVVVEAVEGLKVLVKPAQKEG